VITTEGTHVSESKTKAAERLRDAERLAAAEEYAANNGEKHSSAGNGACYINNGWPSTYGFINRGIARLIQTADEKQLKKLRGMLLRHLKSIQARAQES
jgi:hypothetical protein